MKTLLHLTTALCCMLMVACTELTEEALRGAGVLARMPRQTGTVEGGLLAGVDLSNAAIYTFRLRQLGGTGVLNTSMGTSYTVDNQVSFKDAMQTIAAVASSVATFKAAAAAEITNRFKAGQITIQQKNALDNQLANVQTQADLTKFLEGLKAMETVH